MGYRAENVARVRQAFEQKAHAARREAEKRTDYIRSEYPHIGKTIQRLAQAGLLAMRTALAHTGEGEGEDIAQQIRRLKEQTLPVREQLRSELVECGFAPDYLDIHYECPECADTGFLGTKMCVCMHSALVAEGIASSGLGALSEKQTFENFSLSYYEQSTREYSDMKYILEQLKQYARRFSDSTASNLILYGTTGLGKTHLSVAVGREVIERGYDVVYETAPNMFTDYEREKFGKNNAEASRQTGIYTACDLLILDDLGAEMVTQFTVSCLYNLLNTRTNRNKSTIISTNLDQRALRAKYDDRITSRILGEFSPYFFRGGDIRMKKLLGT